MGNVVYKAVKRGNQWAVVRYTQLQFGSTCETICYFLDHLQAIQVADQMNREAGEGSEI